MLANRLGDRTLSRPRRLPSRMHARLALPVHSILQAATLVGLALLGGCVGAPQPLQAAKPVMPGRPVKLRVAPRPSPAAAPTLSASEKRRLFQEFQQSQGASEAAAGQGPAP